MKNDERIPVVHDNCVLIQPVVHTNLKIYVLPINPNGYVNGIRNCLDTNLKEIRKHQKLKKKIFFEIMQMTISDLLKIKGATYPV